MSGLIEAAQPVDVDEGLVQNTVIAEPGEPPANDTTWVRRHRRGAMPDERTIKAERVTALETAIRGFAERKTTSVVTPTLGLTYDSLTEAYDYYNMYSWETGFGIRYGKSRNNVKGARCMQEFVCCCSGKPSRENSSSCRTKCRAMVRLLRIDDGGWYISENRTCHNHQLLDTCASKLHFPSHRHIHKYTRELVAQLRQNNVNLSKVYSVIGTYFGRIENVPFTKRCLRTLCGKISREQADDDVRKTIELFSEMKEKDSDFSYTVQVDDESRIRTLLWSNGRSKLQYHCFGDVVTFDTTYKTNLYDMPFGLFVGVNNHFQSTIFAGVLMRDEQSECFEWVFREFVKMMGGKVPVTILTDQARAMEIEKVWPETTHHWCKWHVLRKAKENLGFHYTKKSDFRAEFHRLINDMLTIEEFERGWTELTKKYSLQSNSILIQIYEFDREQEEGFQEKRTKLAGVVLKVNIPIEQHASTVYTRAMFEIFGKSLYYSGSYYIKELVPRREYLATHVKADSREKWYKSRYKVVVSEFKDMFSCECALFEHMGMICCHALKVMIVLGLNEIPMKHIMKRWTVDPRDILPEHLKHYQKDVGLPNSTTFRHNAMYISALELVMMGDSNPRAFEYVMSGLAELKAGALALSNVKDGMSLIEKRSRRNLHRLEKRVV